LKRGNAQELTEFWVRSHSFTKLRRAAHKARRTEPFLPVWHRRKNSPKPLKEYRLSAKVMEMTGYDQCSIEVLAPARQLGAIPAGVAANWKSLDLSDGALWTLKHGMR